MKKREVIFTVLFAFTLLFDYIKQLYNNKYWRSDDPDIYFFKNNKKTADNTNTSDIAHWLYFYSYFSSLLHVTFISTISQIKFVVIFQESNNYFTQNSLNPA